MNTRTQEDRVIDYLATGKGLTPIVALTKFGCFRLGARIHSLRRKGDNITAKRVKRGNAVVAEYKLCS